MASFRSTTVERLSPYQPGEQMNDASWLKLNTNESPFRPPEGAIDALRHVAPDILRRYPYPDATELRAAIGRVHSLPSNHVFVGNGSDEVLANAFAALLKQDRPLYFPDIIFNFYQSYCRLYAIDLRHFSLDGDFRIDLSLVDTGRYKGQAPVHACPTVMPALPKHHGQSESPRRYAGEN